MLAKCTNRSCSASFRRLKDGRLFRLETDPTLWSSQSNRGEYFWLCDRCSPSMTLPRRWQAIEHREPTSAHESRNPRTKSLTHPFLKGLKFECT
jgi:hypothetical protein